MKYVAAFFAILFLGIKTIFVKPKPEPIDPTQAKINLLEDKMLEFSLALDNAEQAYADVLQQLGVEPSAAQSWAANVFDKTELYKDLQTQANIAVAELYKK